MQLCPLFLACRFICVICSASIWVFLPMYTFLLSVSLSCRFAGCFKPWGQVFCPTVGILLDLDCRCFYDPRFPRFSYQKFLYIDCPEIIIISVLCGDGIKRLCKTATVAMGLPLVDTVHIFACIFLSYPLISL